MTSLRSRRIVVAGGGIAGLTAGLAFAQKGFEVSLFERAPRFEEIGAGLQLSPNATRILARLGVLEGLNGVAVRPEAICLRDAKNLREFARVPLGDPAERRWGAPYLVAHRADLQSALLARAASEPSIQISTGVAVRDAAFHPHGVTVSIDSQGAVREVAGMLVVGADGVWSELRRRVEKAAPARFSGNVAWRATLRRDAETGSALDMLFPPRSVTAFLHPGAHLIAYPIRGGASVNLAAFSKGPGLAESWAARSDPAPLFEALKGSSAGLLDALRQASPWSSWPVHTMRPASPWTHPGGLALVGDAAHAMTPFAAQGAAMAIEDAAVLASCVVATDNLAAALARYESERRPRVARVAGRGAFNRFVWHAAGPIAWARDAVLARRSPARLAADLDWLYGWDYRKMDDVAGASGVRSL
jgi:salicylate hydroxylase